jgi:hypothetical protein
MERNLSGKKSMKRDYSTGVKEEQPKFFVGTEVEHSPAFGKKTLFVVGLQPAEEILKMAKKNKVEHIYFGANMSFSIDQNIEQYKQYMAWHDPIMFMLKEDYWVTLDYDVKYCEGVLESGWDEHDRFISMVSVKLPYIRGLGYNACIKLDDSDFRATNPGVWVHPVHNLTSYETFTDWSKYTKDTIIR